MGDMTGFRCGACVSFALLHLGYLGGAKLADIPLVNVMNHLLDRYLSPTFLARFFLVQKLGIFKYSSVVIFDKCWSPDRFTIDILDIFDVSLKVSP